MRAAIYRSFGGPIRIEQVPYPPTPDHGVVVQVLATGVCRSDWHGWKGHDSDVHEHGLPFCPGHELSGIVCQVGPQVRQFRPGDRVAVPFILSCGECSYCQEGQPTVCTRQQQPGFTQWGSFAEYVALPLADRNLRHIPEGVSFVQAAALGCRFTTAYRAVLQQGRLREFTQKQQQPSVAIFGCGGLGLSCIMLAVAEGNTKQIIAVDVSRDALEKAQELGATHTVQVRKGANSNELVRKQVMEITGGHGADISIDAAGFAATCENAVYCTRRGGRMVQVGLPIGEVKPVVPMGLVAGRELELVGSHGFAADDLPGLLQMVAEKKLDPSRLVEKEVTLEEGAKAIEDMDKGSPLGITVVTKFQSEKSKL
jgi:alcohol dehydrogenase